MEGEKAEFNDWEVLPHNSDDSNSSELVTENPRNINNFDDGIDGDSEGMIRSDYFSLENQQRLADVIEEENGSVESDNPSWIDPAPETRFPAIHPGEFWPDSASDRSDDRKLSDSEAKKELGQAEFEGIGEIPALNLDGGTNHSIAEQESGAIEEVKKKNESEGEKRMVVWWKVPLEVLKYCAFRVSPVWTVSVAAAMLGIVILGRRLYKMKRKTQSLQLKVTMDDKKVSQFMSRAARLNEAFSVVRRVPIVRPALPAAGVSPWPVMSLR
ncbi:hypothetical protein TIFTF001_025558 [Ficus carica]|uniref:DUF6821 domain-containing protein n=1 Tax=Ficus carica TaxID=3494 RepID=A0AA88DKK9_FICCA|nr:hypothetical protein TIFTF001_025558 [Ficus carica]